MTLVARPGALTDIGLHRKTNEDTFVVAPPPVSYTHLTLPTNREV